MQKGFIALPITAYMALGCAAVVALVSGYAYIQTSRLEACKSEFQSFKSEIDRLAKEQEVNNKVKKQKADDELKKLKSVNDTLSKRVRDNASTSFVREAGATGVPEVTCYKSDQLDEGLRKFVTGVTGLIEQGQSAAIELNNARSWANSPSQ